MQLQSMFSKPTRNCKVVFSINKNKHVIKHKLNYEITKDTNYDELSIHRPLQKRERTEKEYGCFPFV